LEKEKLSTFLFQLGEGNTSGEKWVNQIPEKKPKKTKIGQKKIEKTPNRGVYVGGKPWWEGFHPQTKAGFQAGSGARKGSFRASSAAGGRWPRESVFPKLVPCCGGLTTDRVMIFEKPPTVEPPQTGAGFPFKKRWTRQGIRKRRDFCQAGKASTPGGGTRRPGRSKWGPGAVIIGPVFQKAPCPFPKGRLRIPPNVFFQTPVWPSGSITEKKPGFFCIPDLERTGTGPNFESSRKSDLFSMLGPFQKPGLGVSTCSEGLDFRVLSNPLQTDSFPARVSRTGKSRQGRQKGAPIWGRFQKFPEGTLMATNSEGGPWVFTADFCFADDQKKKSF